jgi:hypothetical protein
MGKGKVYANGREVSGKATSHQVIAAMPDVCMSPPPPPAGPVPIPYPNSAKASDTSDGSKTVKIGGKEVSLKGKSKYKKTTGDEAATRNFGAGVVSHNITGALLHEAGSFDVKIEGCGAVRHLDLTTGNHSNTSNAVPGVEGATVDTSAAAKQECEELSKNNETTRKELGALSSDKCIVGHDDNCAGTTVASMDVGSLQSAHNNQKAQMRLDSRLAPGGDSAVRSGEKTPLCEGSSYKHPAPAMQKSGHAEARLMAEIASAPPSKITLNIDWRPKSGGASKMPCPDCHEMLCAAAKDCGHEISLCREDGAKVPLECPKPGEPSHKSYRRLEKAMGEV